MEQGDKQATDLSRTYLDPATLERIKRLDVRARLVVEGFISGQHKSPYHGYAVEFATHREYAPGDDLRHIDWKVWSRSDRLYVKEYEEETNLSCTLVVDASKSMAYGAGWRKYDFAATAAASLAYLLQQKQDAVGLVTFTSKIETILPASAHPSHLKALVHALETTQPDQTTDLGQVFVKLAQHVRRRGLVMLFSDLFAPRSELAEAIRQFRLRKHEVVIFQVLHTDELDFPFSGNVEFRGLEQPARSRVDPRAIRQSYVLEMEKFLHEVRTLCAKSGADHVLLKTNDPLDAVLGRYLAYRQKARRGVRAFT